MECLKVECDIISSRVETFCEMLRSAEMSHSASTMFAVAKSAVNPMGPHVATQFTLEFKEDRAESRTLLLVEALAELEALCPPSDGWFCSVRVLEVPSDIKS